MPCQRNFTRITTPASSSPRCTQLRGRHRIDRAIYTQYNGIGVTRALDTDIALAHVIRHALRAGITPIVTAAGLDLAYLFGGAIITESIFSLPGMGSLSVDSVVQSDLPVITAITLVSGVFILVANLIVDLLYGVLDPRVRTA